MDTDVVCCDCRDLAAIGCVSGSGLATMNINIAQYVQHNHTLDHVVKYYFTI